MPEIKKFIHLLDVAKESELLNRLKLMQLYDKKKKGCTHSCFNINWKSRNPNYMPKKALQELFSDFNTLKSNIPKETQIGCLMT